MLILTVNLYERHKSRLSGVISLPTEHKSPRTLSVLLILCVRARAHARVCVSVCVYMGGGVCAYGFRCPARSKAESYLPSYELHSIDAGNHTGVLWKTRATPLRTKPSPHTLFFSCISTYFLV